MESKTGGGGFSLFSLLAFQRHYSRLPKTGVIAAGLLAALTVAVGMMKYGLSVYSGASNLFAVTLDPSSPSLDPTQDFVLRNSGVAYALGRLSITSSTLWIAIGLSLSLVALAAPFFFGQIRTDRSQLQLTFVVVAGGPILPLLLTWIGGYDALPILGLSIVALSQAPIVKSVGWLLVGTTHAELGLVAAAILALYLAIIADSGLRIRAAMATLVLAIVPLGVMLLATKVLVDSWGGSTSRITLALGDFGNRMFQFELVMPAMLFSILGVTWLLLLRKESLRQRASLSLVIMTLVMGMTLPLLFVDYTRVLGILTLPLVLTWTLRVNEEQRQRLWSTFAVGATVIPVPLFIAGTVGFGGFINFLTWHAATQI